MRGGIRRSPGWRWAAAAAVIGAAVGLAVPAQPQHSPAAGSSRGPGIVHDPAAYARALKSGDWVQSPEGLVNKTCVTYAPNNAVVTNDEVIAPSGARQKIKTCTQPTLAYPGSPTARTVQPAAAQLTSFSLLCSGPASTVWAYSCWNSPKWITFSTEEYAVPNDPAVAGAQFGLWGGLEDPVGSTVLQGVLQWGVNPKTHVTNPKVWYMTPWYVWGFNAHYVVGTSVHVNAGNTIVSNLQSYNCDGSGDCSWTITVIDSTTGSSSSYTVGSGVPFYLVFNGVLEVHTLAGCNSLPSSGHGAFRDFQVANSDYLYVTPSFGYGATSSSQCNTRMTATPTSADILWSP